MRNFFLKFILASMFLVGVGVDCFGVVHSVDWHPTGDSLAIGSSNANRIEVHSFDNLMTLTTVNKDVPTGLSITLTDSRDRPSTVRYVDWHPLGLFLAYAADNSYGVYELEYVNHALIFKNGSPVDLKVGSSKAVSWSPDGSYLAVAAGSWLRVYSFDGSSLSQKASVSIGLATFYGVDWHPDGTYLAVGTDDTNNLSIYEFDGSSLTFKDSKGYGTQYLRAVSWSNDGKFLAIGGLSPASGDELQVYSFSSASGLLSVNPIASRDYGSGPWVEIRSISWSYDGLYLAIGGAPGGAINWFQLRIYSFNDGFVSVDPVGRRVFSGTNLYSIDFNSYRNYILYGAGYLSSDSARHWGIEEFLGGSIDGRSKMEIKDYSYTFENSDVATGATFFNDGLSAADGGQVTFADFEGEIRGEIAAPNATLKVKKGDLNLGKGTSITTLVNITSELEYLKLHSKGCVVNG